MVIKTGLVQLNTSFSGHKYLPYSAGLIQAYTQKYVEDAIDLEFLLPLFSRMPLNQAVEHVHEADIVFFSTYVWNIRLSLGIAKSLKRVRPEVVVVLGGPQVPNAPEAFLREHRYIDVVCHNEGEQIALSIFRNYQDRSWHKVPSVSFIDERGDFIQTQRAPRIKTLDEIPSPFLEGVFDPLMRAYPDEQWLVMWETNRGCPFSCTFCDWGSAIQSKVYQFSMERLQREIDWMRERRIEFVFCCDANFGMLKRDLELVKYMAESKATYGYPKALSVQNTKNAPERAFQVQKILSDAGLNKGVTLSLQSIDGSTLSAIKRSNISTDAFRELQHRFSSEGVETYTDMILGLPEETYGSFADGVSTVIENGQHNRIQFGNLSILPNAEMGQREYQERYGMEIVESPIINIHGSLLSSEEVEEVQQLVVATRAMPRQEWRRSRAFCWMTALLHYNKLLQIPFMVIHKLTAISYRDLIEAFGGEQLQSYPILKALHDGFQARAEDIQKGGPEYSRSDRWLNIWWPDDELAFIKLCTEDKLDSFYSEAGDLLCKLTESRRHAIPTTLLQETLMLNQNLIKLPFQTFDRELTLSHNIWEYYSSARRGLETELLQGEVRYVIDRRSSQWDSWERWCKEVVWYGNKRGAYLYSIARKNAADVGTDTSIESPALSGHH